MSEICAKSLQLCLTLCDPVDCSLCLLCPWNSPGKNAGVGCHAQSSPRDLPDPGIEPTSPVAPDLQMDF